MTGLNERPQSVIGPRVFRAWWRLLRLLLWIIVPCAAVGIALVTALTGGTVGELISAAVVGGLNVGVHVAFWTTLAFCVLEHSCVETSAIVHAVVSLGVSAAAIVLLARGWLLHPDLTAGFADTPARVLTAAGVTLAVVIAGVGIASTGGGFRRAVSDRTDA